MLLSELKFGAFLAYSPNGSRDVDPHGISQRFRSAIKNDWHFAGRPAIDLAADRLAEVLEAPLSEFFGPEAVLVPTPRSAPFPAAGLEIPLGGAERDFLWVPQRLCEAFVARRLAGSCRPLLRRVHRVARSSGAHPRDRPTPEAHFASLSSETDLLGASRYVIVDDVVTRGATLLASASRLREANPRAEVWGFALLRAISNPAEFSRMREPVVGEIVLRPQGDTLRRP